MCKHYHVLCWGWPLTVQEYAGRSLAQPLLPDIATMRHSKVIVAEWVAQSAHWRGF
jgi:hypothetical protein